MDESRNTVAVPQNDLWVLLLCTVRYAMGRMSYITVETTDLLRKHEKDLKKEQRAQIRDEVQKELDRAERDSKTLGMDMDHRVWAKLVNDWKDA